MTTSITKTITATATTTTRRSTWLALGASSLMLAGCASLHDENYQWCGAQSCAAAPIVAAAPAPAPAVLAAPAAMPQRVTLSADALFEFDRSGARDILPKGRTELDALVAALRRHGVQVQSLLITGHADRLGSASYNEALALRRATTVRDYLQAGGVGVPMQVRSAGEREPVTTGCKGTTRTPALIVCLQPDRRVVVDILGLQQPGSK